MNHINLQVTFLSSMDTHSSVCVCKSDTPVYDDISTWIFFSFSTDIPF